MTTCICVWYWFIFLPYVSPFLENKSWRVISTDVSTKHHVIKAEHAQTKSGNGAIDTVGYYHRSKLCCLGICIVFFNKHSLFFHLINP